MHAADLVDPLPAVRPGDDALAAVRQVCRHGLQGLVVPDERGAVIRAMSSIDLLRLALSRYVWEDPRLARVFDERQADRIAVAPVDMRVGDVVGEATDRIPTARPQATIVELAERMARQCCPPVLVEKDQGGPAGVVTANRLLELTVAATEDEAAR